MKYRIGVAATLAVLIAAPASAATKTCHVPKVIGDTYTQAKRAMIRAHCGAPSADGAGRPGTVLLQFPPPGAVSAQQVSLILRGTGHTPTSTQISVTHANGGVTLNSTVPNLAAGTFPVGAPVTYSVFKGRTLVALFSFDQPCALTDSVGSFLCPVSLAKPFGRYAVVATFAGTSTYAPSSSRRVRL